MRIAGRPGNKRRFHHIVLAAARIDGMYCQPIAGAVQSKADKIDYLRILEGRALLCLELSMEACRDWGTVLRSLPYKGMDSIDGECRPDSSLEVTVYYR